MKLETVIGLEVHVELSTQSKLFCGCSTAFGAPVNAHVCPVCLGMPGTLPVLNRKVPEYAMAVALALHCTIPPLTRFDRKNYFYPDNPQNYQISQLFLPIGTNGWLDTGAGKRVRIHELHMEEDAGKLVHAEDGSGSLVDHNRAGVPLIEIVTEPDMRSAEEVLDFLTELRSRILYLGVSDCRLQEGSMRADVNLSLREKGSDALGTRTEMKNLASFTAIRRAISAEAQRQEALLSAGEAVEQETRRFDEDSGKTLLMRGKETIRDYRYFPEPDLPPLRIDEEWIGSIRSRQPEFRGEKKERFRTQYAIGDKEIGILTEDPHLAELFEETAALSADAGKASNWLLGETLRLMKEEGIEAKDLRFSAGNLAELIRMTKQGEVSSTAAKEIFARMFENNADPHACMEELGLRQQSDADVIRGICEKVLAENPDAVADYRAGKDRALGFLVGQGMKASGGRADPGLLRECMKELL
ncbi:MAG: Asp-tRNA(Asn)/Glu-tRNA(Gln) amidotransferase subunit GatB [Lachnospiraceae bacterium]|nr:Asp-tRNA(Asn)/Glu-tRNA(Gln) amidotransferase subunit GatB [Lachnospiraceae bacterium]